PNDTAPSLAGLQPALPRRPPRSIIPRERITRSLTGRIRLKERIIRSPTLASASQGADHPLPETPRQPCRAGDPRETAHLWLLAGRLPLLSPVKPKFRAEHPLKFARQRLQQSG